jgi:hypothetical protein
MTYQLLNEKKNHSILKTVSDDTRMLLSTSQRARTTTQKDELENSISLVGDEFDLIPLA